MDSRMAPMANHDVSGDDQGKAKGEVTEKDLPAIDFSTFVLSLSTTADFHHGLLRAAGAHSQAASRSSGLLTTLASARSKNRSRP